MTHDNLPISKSSLTLANSLLQCKRGSTASGIKTKISLVYFGPGYLIVPTMRGYWLIQHFALGQVLLSIASERLKVLAQNCGFWF